MCTVIVGRYQQRQLRVGAQRICESHLLVDLIVSAFAIVTIAMLLSGLMFGAFLTGGQMHALKERMLQASKPA